MFIEQEDTPRCTEASRYLMEHKILELFNNMTSQLMYHRPGKFDQCI